MSLKSIIADILRMGHITPEQLRKAGAKVGSNVNIYTKKIDMGHAFLLEIGNNVTISDARILLHDGSTKLSTGYSRVGRVIIGDNVFIGADAIILPNVEIGSNVVIGAGSIVARNIESNSIVVGSPAKKVSTYDNYVQMNQELIRTGERVYKTHYSKKTQEEINLMKKELMNGGIGYDI